MRPFSENYTTLRLCPNKQLQIIHVQYGIITLSSIPKNNLKEKRFGSLIKVRRYTIVPANELTRVFLVANGFFLLYDH